MKAPAEWYDPYKADVDRALQDKKLQLAVRRFTTTFTAATANALKKLPYIPYLKKRAREIRSWSIDNCPELVKMFKENIEALGGVFYLAKDAKECREYVCKVCLDHEAKLVTKAKSMVSEEIFLNDALTEKGIEVRETDLGEFIIQLRKEKPSHVVGPALHIPREDIAELFSRITGEKLPPDNVPALTSVARRLLRGEFIKADVGISGANVVTAETGTIVLIENEGNIRHVTNLPPVHICVTGIEKIVPTLEDAAVIIQLLPPYATGQLMSVYVSLITGPSRTGDIEMQTVIPAHGPKELYAVLLDNGRQNLINDPDFKEASYCIRCGSCLNICPVYRRISGQVWGYRYMGAIGAIWTAFCHGIDKAAPFAFSCTECGHCRVACPLEIDIPTMIEKLRYRLTRLGYVAPPHAQVAGCIEKSNNPFGEATEKRIEWLKA
ncbi:MAG: CoB--CoM heterodisulfide reductase iron-sulfur subunit C [Candidatus Bathyarchaeota archaeon BA1]|nr:MAG: CoB--CoM heterodisulfide reductase iron-sulfur subunit C [Candidatus Bathyarchaeota archaeon BA1]